MGRNETIGPSFPPLATFFFNGMHFNGYEAKLTNFKLKTRIKQLLGFLILHSPIGHTIKVNFKHVV